MKVQINEKWVELKGEDSDQITRMALQSVVGKPRSLIGEFIPPTGMQLSRSPMLESKISGFGLKQQ